MDTANCLKTGLLVMINCISKIQMSDYLSKPRRGGIFIGVKQLLISQDSCWCKIRFCNSFLYSSLNLEIISSQDKISVISSEAFPAHQSRS